jgi:di/tricarboxylate transporter
VGSALNNYWLKWNLEEVEVTFILMMIPMLMAGYTYFRYIFSGIEHTEVSTKQGYKKERGIVFKRSLLVGVVFFIIHIVVKGFPTNYDEGIDLVALPIIFTFLYFLFELISLKRSAKKNEELDD